MTTATNGLAAAVITLLLPVVAPFLAHGGEPSGPPPITPLRQNEDYRYINNPLKRNGLWWEPLKYAPLPLHSQSASGSPPPSTPFLTFGGEARVRYEWIENSGFGAGPQDAGGYLLTRYLPYVSITVPRLFGGGGTSTDLLSPKLEIFGQAIIAHNDYDARGPSPVDEEDLDALQAFAKITFSLPTGGELSLQGGRQIISYGTERLLGSRYGPNIPLSFDGGLARWRGGPWDVSAFFLQPVRIDPHVGNNESTGHRQIWSVYTTRTLGDIAPCLPRAAADFYYIGYLNDDATFAAGSGRELRHTLGSRLFGKQQLQCGLLDWNYEAILQFGTFQQNGAAEGTNRNILAWSLGTETGYTFPSPCAPRFSLRANAISGDGNPGDSTLGTFNPLFPKGKYFGELTPVGPYNLFNLQAGFNVNISRTLTLSLQGGPYWRYSTHDAVYGVSGNIERAAPTQSSSSADIGAQAEAVLEWAPRRELSFLASYSHFLPGDFLKETGPAESIQYIALEAVFQF